MPNCKNNFTLHFTCVRACVRACVMVNHRQCEFLQEEQKGTNWYKILIRTEDLPTQSKQRNG